MEYQMAELLKAPLEQKYAIPAICVSNMETVLGTLLAAQRKKSPVIIQTAYSQLEAQGITYSEIVRIIRSFNARFSDVPYAIHLDHGMSEQECIDALDAGFFSVMYDGSSTSYEKNIDVTRRIKEIAGTNRSVEAELRKVGGEEGGIGECEMTIIETDPELLCDFIDRTGVDAIAVSIGNVHGIHSVAKKAPELNLKLLKNLHENSKIPLVLHGASGIPKDDIRKAVGMGICKINYYTQLDVKIMESIKEHTDLTMMNCMRYAAEAFAEEVMELINICGSDRKY